MFLETILRTKLFSLPLHRNRVARPRLLSKLTDALCPKTRLMLICTPAGYRKITLVVDWLKQIGLPAAWLSVDETGSDLPRFLAAVLRLVDEYIGAPLLSALQSPQLPAIKAEN